MDYRANATAPQPDRSILVVGINGRVFGIDRVTGELRWRNELPQGSSGEVFLAVGYGAVVASAVGARIFCLDYLTGQERWSLPTHALGRATIVIEPDQIVCAKGGYIDCFAPHGVKLWSQPLTGAGIGKIALGYPNNMAQADDAASQ